MSLPVTLYPPNIIVTASSTTIGIELQGNNATQFKIGTVVQVYDGTDIPVVGQSILFEVGNSLQIKYGSTLYYMLDAGKIQFKETPVIAP